MSDHQQEALRRPEFDSPAPIEPGGRPQRPVPAPAIANNEPTLTCPACGFEQAPTEECLKCGVVVSKYRARPRPEAAAALPPGARPQDEIAADLTEQGYEPRVSQSGAAEDDGVFAPEKRGLDKGVLGGLAMMAIAVAWFGLGWMAGYIFFYPPILFVIGLFGLLKGLFTGNVAG